MPGANCPSGTAYLTIPLKTISSKGGTDVGVEMANDKRVKLVSFTGSTQVMVSGLFDIVFIMLVSFIDQLMMSG